jgi:hypothetical protein
MLRTLFKEFAGVEVNTILRDGVFKRSWRLLMSTDPVSCKFGIRFRFPLK